MFRIRTKLLLLSLTIIVLLNGISYFLYRNGQESSAQYNHFLQKLYLLNDISRKTDEQYQTIHAYVIERTPSYYEKFLDGRRLLKEDQSKLNAMIQNRNNYLILENYTNMITSFLEESDIVADAFQKQNIDMYSTHLSKANQIRLYIHEKTLDLLNDQLTQYHEIYKNMTLKNHYLNIMGICIFISSFLLSLLFSYWFSRGITKPVERLTRAAKDISRGRFDGPPIKVNSKDEMRFLSDTFNTMKANIQELIEQNQEKAELDRMLNEMELKNLQNQINPHFLFNVLNTISKKAYLEGAEESSQLMDSVAALLRYNLGQLDQPVTLAQEIQMVEEYFIIQQSRFGDRVHFDIRMDERCEQLEIPNLTLQPIVENAFNHGIQSFESGGRIAVSVEKTSNGAVIVVSDNGVGMDEATRLALLQAHETGKRIQGSDKATTGIGFRNVIRRLRLFYEIEDVVDITSSPQQGTTVILKIPDKTLKDFSVRITGRGVIPNGMAFSHR
ncbi:MAG: sensor histidine kinase [Tuberibacillus sp.]